MGNANMLHHYSDVETLRKILASNKILFNRLDKVDDADEMDVLIKDLAYSTYISCWTEKEDDLLFWSSYAGQKHSLESIDKSRGVCLSLTKSPFRVFKYTRQEHNKLLDGLYRKYIIQNYNISKVSLSEDGKAVINPCIPVMKINDKLYFSEKTEKPTWINVIWQILSLYELYAFSESKRNSFYVYHDNPETILVHFLDYNMTYSDINGLSPYKVEYNRNGTATGREFQFSRNTMYLNIHEMVGMHKSDKWREQQEWRYRKIFDVVGLSSYWNTKQFKTPLYGNHISDLLPSHIFMELDNSAINTSIITTSPYCHEKDIREVQEIINDYNSSNGASIKVTKSCINVRH